MCGALANDIEALRDLMSTDLVHIHTNGLTEDLEAYLSTVANRLEFLEIERGELKVRVYRDAAVVTGLLTQMIRVRATGATVPLRATLTQVWIRTADAWKQVSFQASAVPAS